MNALETKDWVLLAGAAYIAIISLVRLMIRHRGATAARLAAQVEEERRRAAADSEAKKGQSQAA